VVDAAAVVSAVLAVVAVVAAAVPVSLIWVYPLLVWRGLAPVIETPESFGIQL
jgi:hypothetical protein